MPTAAIETEIGWLEVMADENAITHLNWRGVKPARLASTAAYSLSLRGAAAAAGRAMTVQRPAARRHFMAATLALTQQGTELFVTLERHFPAHGAFAGAVLLGIDQGPGAAPG